MLNRKEQRFSRTICERVATALDMPADCFASSLITAPAPEKSSSHASVDADTFLQLAEFDIEKSAPVFLTDQSPESRKMYLRMLTAIKPNAEAHRNTTSKVVQYSLAHYFLSFADQLIVSDLLVDQLESQAIDAIDSAVKAAERSGDTKLHAAALMHAGSIRYSSRSLAEALSFYDRAKIVVDHLEDGQGKAWLTARLLGDRARTLVELDDIGQASSELIKSFEAGQEAASAFRLACSRSYRAAISLRESAYDDAVRDLESAVNNLDEIPAEIRPLQTVIFKKHLAIAQMCAGDDRSGTLSLQEATAICAYYRFSRQEAAIKRLTASGPELTRLLIHKSAPGLTSTHSLRGRSVRHSNHK